MLLRQKSFINEVPTLYLVATPIGNMQELTPRAIEVLKSVEVIACEDTRTSGVLLQHFDIKTRLIAHHNFNEKESSKGILKLLEQGKDVAIISDAGYPLISDPGQGVVSLCIENGFNVVPISGASAGINALVASGLSAQPYIFKGFLSQSKGEAIKELNELKTYPMTIILYEAPHRIKKTLQNCLDVLGDRKICLARELTKKYEEFIRGTISEVIEIADDIKGEMVIVIEGYKKNDDIDTILKQVDIKIDEYIKNGISASNAIKMVAKEFGLSKNEVYNHYHQS